MPLTPDAGTQPAWIGLGANLGDAKSALEQAVDAIGRLPSTQMAGASPLYRSTPVDASGPDYLNAVVHIHTALAPLALLHGLQAIELAAGRQRPYRNAPRTLDLDILLFGQPAQPLNSPALTIPHPRMHERAFVLRPLADLDATLVTASQLQALATQAAERLPEAQQWRHWQR